MIICIVLCDFDGKSSSVNRFFKRLERSGQLVKSINVFKKYRPTVDCLSLQHYCQTRISFVLYYSFSYIRTFFYQGMLLIALVFCSSNYVKGWKCIDFTLSMSDDVLMIL